jgi:hypothetical protein
MSPEARFVLPLGTVVILVLATVSVFVLYDPLKEGIPSPPLALLAGAVSCSLALFLIFFFLRPVRK